MTTPSLASFKLPRIANEVNVHYSTNSPERVALEKELAAMTAAAPFAVPAFIGGQAVRAFVPPEPR